MEKKDIKENMTILIGTINEDKIKAVRYILNEMNLNYNVKGYIVSSEVSGQPFGEKETILGAGNRAKNVLLKSINENVCAIGIENGIIKGYGYNRTIL